MTIRCHLLSVACAASLLTATLACTAKTGGPGDTTEGSTDTGDGSSTASEPAPDAGTPSCEYLSEKFDGNSGFCEAAPNCKTVPGFLVDTGNTCDFETSDILKNYGCVTIPCEPYQGPICKEGTTPQVGTVGWIGYDEYSCVPHGWVPCPEVEVCECGFGPCSPPP